MSVWNSVGTSVLTSNRREEWSDKNQFEAMLSCHWCVPVLLLLCIVLYRFVLCRVEIVCCQLHPRRVHSYMVVDHVGKDDALPFEGLMINHFNIDYSHQQCHWYDNQTQN